MAHNLDFSNGRANMAFVGSRDDIWHRLGHQMQAGMSIADWAKAAGLAWSAALVPALAALEGPQFDHIDASKRLVPVNGDRYVVRNDTGAVLGHVSDGYKPVQPADVLAWFDQYISVDDRFALDVAGSLRGGKIIWATATYNGGIDVGGPPTSPACS